MVVLGQFVGRDLVLKEIFHFGALKPFWRLKSQVPGLGPQIGLRTEIRSPNWSSDSGGTEVRRPNLSSDEGSELLRATGQRPSGGRMSGGRGAERRACSDSTREAVTSLRSREVTA